jgi:hypothetical protein
MYVHTLSHSICMYVHTLSHSICMYVHTLSHSICMYVHTLSHSHSHSLSHPIREIYVYVYPHTHTHTHRLQVRQGREGMRTRLWRLQGVSVCGVSCALARAPLPPSLNASTHWPQVLNTSLYFSCLLHVSFATCICLYFSFANLHVFTSRVCYMYMPGQRWRLDEHHLPRRTCTQRVFGVYLMCK